MGREELGLRKIAIILIRQAPAAPSPLPIIPSSNDLMRKHHSFTLVFFSPSLGYFTRSTVSSTL